MSAVEQLRAAITALQETENHDPKPYRNAFGDRFSEPNEGRVLDTRLGYSSRPVFDTGDVPRALLIALFENAIRVEAAALDVPPWQSAMRVGIPAAVLALAAAFVKGEKK